MACVKNHMGKKKKNFVKINELGWKNCMKINELCWEKNHMQK